MAASWPASDDVRQIFTMVKEKYHHDRIGTSKIAVAFVDSKPFIKGRFNFGKVVKFSNMAKLWHPAQGKFDFLSILCSDAWHSLLNANQREALVDLHLTRCSVEYEPEFAEDEKGKKHPIKDEWGRIQLSTNMKFDEFGVPKWKVLPQDLNVYTENVIRYGPWCEEILEFKDALEDKALKINKKIKFVTAESAPEWQNIGTD